MRSRALVGLAWGAAAALGAACAKDTSPTVRADLAPSVSVSTSASAPPLDPRLVAGAASYTRYCALCHGPDAKGYAADHAPSLVNQTFLATATDEFLLRSIREGRPGTAMAGYARDRGGPMEDEEIASIIGHLRSKGPPQVPLEPAPLTGVAALGEPVYAQNCERCHGTPKTRGDAPHLANGSFLSTATDPFLRYAIVNGRPGTPMNPFGDTLAPAAIDDVVAFLRGWAKIGPNAASPPRTPAIDAADAPLVGPVVINPKGRPPTFTLRDARFVPADQVKKALDAKNRIIIIDARATSDWIAAHIPGSISVPYFQFARLDALPQDGTWVVAYCACPHHASGVVVDELRKRGFPNTAILDEGILEWQKRKYPITLSTDPQPPVPNQRTRR